MAEAGWASDPSACPQHHACTSDRQRGAGQWVPRPTWEVRQDCWGHARPWRVETGGEGSRGLRQDWASGGMEVGWCLEPTALASCPPHQVRELRQGRRGAEPGGHPVPWADLLPTLPGGPARLRAAGPGRGQGRPQAGPPVEGTHGRDRWVSRANAHVTSRLQSVTCQVRCCSN